MGWWDVATMGQYWLGGVSWDWDTQPLVDPYGHPLLQWLRKWLVVGHVPVLGTVVSTVQYRCRECCIQGI